MSAPFQKNNDPTKIDINMQDDTASLGKSSWFSSTANIMQDQNETTKGAFNYIDERRKNLRPWSEFFNLSKFGCPALIGAVPRVKNNLDYFFSNYLCVFIVLMIYCIISQFLMLLALVALGGLIYSIRQLTNKGPILLGGHEIPPSLLYTSAIIVSIPLFYLAGASDAMWWVLGSSFFVVFIHALLYANEEVPGAEFEAVTVSA